MLRLLKRKDTAAGLMFIAIGLGFAYMSSSYRMGSVGSMGPGYFPFWLGILLAALGTIVLASGVRGSDAPERMQERWDPRALLIIVGSIALFGFVLVPLGLIAAIIAVVVLSSLASHEFSWGGTILNAAALIAVSLAIFVWGIGLPLPLWPAFPAQ